MQTNIKLLLLFLVNFNLTKYVKTQNLGDACTDTNNLSGTCKLIFTCQHVMQLKISGGSYSKCGFMNGFEIVCCAQGTITSASNSDISALRSKKYVQHCEQYKSKSFDSELFLTRLSAGSVPIKKTTSKCHQFTFPLVVGGEDAFPREFPHMALIGCQGQNGKYNWGCGGSLISPYYVLTAAHCFEPKSMCNNLPFDVVRLGDLNTEIDSDDAQPINFKINQLIPHPSYNSSTNYNDIGLIKLDKKVDFNMYIRPACLPYGDYNNQSQMIATGWGLTLDAGKRAAHLQKVALDLFTHKSCNDIYNEVTDRSLPVGIIEKTQICAGSHYDEKDTCQGDSGGPLQTVHPNHPCMYSIIGITSHGLPCGIAGQPGVYTRVYNYNDWIESLVWE